MKQPILLTGAIAVSLIAAPGCNSSAPESGGHSAAGSTSAAGAGVSMSGMSGMGAVASGGTGTGGTSAGAGSGGLSSGGAGPGGGASGSGIVGGTDAGGGVSGSAATAGVAAGGVGLGGGGIGGGDSGNAGVAAGGSAGSPAGGGGSGGATAGSAGSGGAQPALCPSTAVLCDGFEDGNLAKWEQDLDGGSLTISSALAANGSSALLVNVPVSRAGGYLRLTGAPLFPLPNKVIWGRAMVRYEGSVPPQHTDIVRAANSASTVPFYNLGSQTDGYPDGIIGVPSILLNYYVNWPDEDCWARPNPTYEIPPDTWMCWEWGFDGNTDEIQFYIDGALERRVDQRGDGCLEGDHVWDAPEFGSFQIGALINQNGATQVQKIWIDDVAVGTDARLGCPPE